MIRVRRVYPGSLGAELDLVPGTELISINGRALNDFLDWEFLAADERFVLLARHPEQGEIAFDIERPYDLPLGIEVEPPRIRRCANRCDFCFVDGNPQGMREPLYVRDDDYRLSFRYGNFATLTNLKPKDLERIFEYRLTPLYVSVHATDPVIRRRLLRNPLAPDVREQLDALGRGGIQCHTQIVLQPGVNDGSTLERSLRDLYQLGEPVLSVSVVPVGLTRFSKLELVREPTPDECRRAVAAVERFDAVAVAERRHHWVYGSDELYLVAQLPLPPAERYGEFEQVENGVGSVRYLQRQISGFRADLDGARIGVLTGTGMGRLMPEVTAALERQTGGTYELIVLENDLFGPSVTTAGLLPGRAFMRALEQLRDLDVALIPAEAVNEHGVFADDMAFTDVRAQAPVDVRLSYDFVDALGTAERGG